MHECKFEKQDGFWTAWFVFLIWIMCVFAPTEDDIRKVVKEEIEAALNTKESN